MRKRERKGGDIKEGDRKGNGGLRPRLFVWCDVKNGEIVS